MINIKINNIITQNQNFDNTLNKILSLNTHLINNNLDYDNNNHILLLNNNYILNGDFILPQKIIDTNYNAIFLNTITNTIYYKTLIHNNYTTNTTLIDGNYYFTEINVENKESHQKIIALYNGYTFHHEMYGYLLHYAKSNNYLVYIYENINDNLGWHTFYSKYYDYSIFNYTEFNTKLLDKFKYIFVISDDDISYKLEYIDTHVICINHCLNIRALGHYNYLNVNNFKYSKLDYVLPICPITNNKVLLNTTIEIAIVGLYFGLNLDIINRLVSDKPLHLHIFSKFPINLNDIKIPYTHYLAYNTSDMYDILSRCHYMLCDYNDETINGNKSSGSYSLAYSSLCKIILSSQSNTYWNLDNVVVFDYFSHENIYLDGIIENLEIVRTMEIGKLEKFLKKIDCKIQKTIYQTGETMDLLPETIELTNSWKKHNPDYKYIFYDVYNRTQFIKSNYSIDFLNVYNIIECNVSKCDFFKYLLLYKYGGIYVDLDTLCLNNLDYILKPHVDFIIPIDLNLGETKYNLSNRFICSIANNNILKSCIDKIIFQTINRQIPKHITDFSGSGLLGMVVNSENDKSSKTIFSKYGITKERFNTILYLYFEPITEYIKYRDIVLLQNKNGK